MGRRSWSEAPAWLCQQIFSRARPAVLLQLASGASWHFNRLFPCWVLVSPRSLCAIYAHFYVGRRLKRCEWTPVLQSCLWTLCTVVPLLCSVQVVKRLCTDIERHNFQELFGALTSLTPPSDSNKHHCLEGQGLCWELVAVYQHIGRGAGIQSLYLRQGKQTCDLHTCSNLNCCWATLLKMLEQYCGFLFVVNFSNKEM